MRLTAQASFKSVIKDETVHDGVLPNFVVITGRNGAGKTHLLQAILAQKVTVDKKPKSIQLVNSIDMRTLSNVYPNSSARAQRLVDALSIADENRYDEGDKKERFAKILGVTREALVDAEHVVGRPVRNWTHDELLLYIPNDVNVSDYGYFSVLDLFSDYNTLLSRNDYYGYRVEKFGTNDPVLSTADFERIHGPRPWDLLNSVLDSIGLPYRYEAPHHDVQPLQNEPSLVHKVTGVKIPASDLSSGEVALLKLAAATYVGNKIGGHDSQRLMLFDEPDSALHPSMARAMLSVLQDILVKQQNMLVIITTHSPTTVAMSPESALYTMAPNTKPRLIKAARSHAIAALLYGIPSLSVESEERRTVIVEGDSDVTRYGKIASLLTQVLPADRSLVFVSAGGKTATGGRSSVVRLVTALRQEGNSRVYGLVDRDEHAGDESPTILVNTERYTLENFILDPLTIAMALLRDYDRDLADSIPGLNYVRRSDEEPGMRQRLVDYVSSQVFPTNEGQIPVLKTIAYLGGFSVSLPEAWLDTKGHELADLIQSTFTQLKKHRPTLEDHLVDRVWTDRPDLIPESMKTVFQRLSQLA
jgi:predicted ATPase